jgi:hypothetical protein
MTTKPLDDGNTANSQNVMHIKHSILKTMDNTQYNCDVMN